MISVNRVVKAREYEYKGLSTDDKPTNCGNNSLFMELDTGDFYYFTDGAWAKVGGGSQPAEAKNVYLFVGSHEDLQMSDDSDFETVQSVYEYISAHYDEQENKVNDFCLYFPMEESEGEPVYTDINADPNWMFDVEEGVYTWSLGQGHIGIEEDSLTLWFSDDL